MTKFRILVQKDTSYHGKNLLFTHKEFFCQTCAKQVISFLNFKMRHIGKIIAILVFSNVFVQNRHKCNFIGEKGATTETSSELTETTYFHQTRETGQILPKIVFHYKMNLIQLF